MHTNHFSFQLTTLNRRHFVYNSCVLRHSRSTVCEADTQKMEDEEEFDIVPVRTAAVEPYQFEPVKNIRAEEARKPAAVRRDCRNDRIGTTKWYAACIHSYVDCLNLDRGQRMIMNEKLGLIG